MDSPWQIRLLGTLSARRDDLVVTRFATSRVAALLARLALFPQRAHSREELAGVLWPDADLDAGRLNLRVALVSLRRQLEPPGCPAGSVLIADRNTIQLNPQASHTDAAQFEAALREAARAADLARQREALHQALVLYEGELLPGFYDEWILEERNRLQALHEEAEIECRILPLLKASPFAALEETSQETASPTEAPPSFSPLINFPGQFTRFFGRAMEKARLTEILADPAVRLVTLLGPGGAGKTRLALETVRSVAEGFDGAARFDGPVCFVPLADIGDSGLIVSAVASALRLPQNGDMPPLDQIIASLSSPSFQRSLLVLDNLEHLGNGGAAEVRTLLERLPRLTCLVTSRQRLSLEGEQEVLLAPLPIPRASSGEPEPPDHLVTYPSVQLFVDRAQSVRPDFGVTPGNAEAVAAVCRSLEGMPLALELAAARIQALTPKQMQQQIEARLDFLISRRRDLPPRHRSLRAALEWSAHLLAPEQTQFFVQLSIFRGGWTAEAAAAVCEVSNCEVSNCEVSNCEVSNCEIPDPLGLLEQLCERSLIAAEESLPGMRFRMLESLREFGDEQMSPRERQALARRHAGYFQSLAVRMDRLWFGPQQNEGLETLTAEYDNLRAALVFCRSDSPDLSWDGGEIGLCLATALGNYWTTRGLMREGIGWLEGALARGGSPEARAGALAQIGWLAAGTSDFDRSTSALTEAIALNRELDNRAGLAAALRMRGVAAIWHGEYALAETALEEALALSSLLGSELVTALTLNSLGVLAWEWKADKERSRGFYEEALPMFLRLGDQQRASYCLHNLGNLAHDFGDDARAEAMLSHSMALADASGDLWHRAYCLRSLGDVFLAQSRWEDAAALLEEGSALSLRLGDKMTEAGTRLSLATVRRRQGAFAQAEAEAHAALRLYQTVARPEGITECWMNLTETAAAQSDWQKSALLLSAADAGQAAFPNDTERDRYNGLYQKTHATLSPSAFKAAWTRGRTLTCDDYGLR